MNILKVAACSFVNGVKQPVFLILLLFFLLIELSLPVAANAVLLEQQKMVIDSSLALLFSTTLLAVLFLADLTVGREIRSGQALLFFSKPITKVQFLIGKGLALFSLTALFFTTCSTASLLIIRASETRHLNQTIIITYMATVLAALTLAGLYNFYFRGQFTSSTVSIVSVLLFIEALLFELISPMELTKGYLLCGCMTFLILTIFASSAVMTSTRFSFSVTGIVILAIIFFSTALPSDHGISLLLPDLRLYWLTELLTSKKTVPSSVVWTGLYRALTFNTIFILSGAFILHKTEIGRAAKKL